MMTVWQERMHTQRLLAAAYGWGPRDWVRFRAFEMEFWAQAATQKLKGGY